LNASRFGSGGGRQDSLFLHRQLGLVPICDRLPNSHAH
jgi:hypothetical protein